MLQLHRIPYGKKGNKPTETRASVYLQHGLLSTSCAFLMNLENQSLAYIMADSNLDVWLADTRGNKYSRKHKIYTTDDKQFWDWSIDEIAQYDLPAVINFIISMAKRDYIYYVGHSQGSMTAFAHFSQNPGISSKVKTLFALSPLAYVKNIKSPLRLFAHLTSTYDLISSMLGYKEFYPSNSIIEWMARSVCPYGTALNICSNMLYLVGGPPTGNLNQSRIPVIYGHYPAGTSVRNIAHLAQGILEGDFRKYDLGYFKNLQVYGAFKPPSYDVTQMTVPTMIFWGLKDWVADPKDVNKLIPLIPKLVGNYKFENSNHYDFVFGMNAAKDYYSIIIKTILQAESPASLANNY
ncbi:gastric triacylglycerol lipase-like [Gordionus sp. m RMFG-2023]|uniref:gastric triacylglycerol lipase-like n=1 Tax=Gordionus sp. m RMFG-2023 TaxID=3053472 RepID=UPI0031FD43D6